ncbi:rheb small monomeric gtpase protein [Rutstroemia sp. NJR-2017a BVV2]|nr:rheb small monomeric gtpase protein [Rutstroemia sp. NJR-2017a BVV2]
MTTYTALAHRAIPSESPTRDPSVDSDLASPNDERAAGAQRSSLPKLSSAKAQRVINIFDVPLSDDEDQPLMRKNVTKSLQKSTQKPAIIRKGKFEAVEDGPRAIGQNVREQKRRKLSPGEQVDDEPVKLKAAPRTLSQPTTGLKPKPLQRTFPKRLVAQTKPSTASVQKSTPSIRRSNQQANGGLAPNSRSPPSPSADELSLQMGGSKSRHISPKGAKMWNALLDDTSGTDGTTTTTAEELSLLVTEPRKALLTRTISEPVTTSKVLRTTSRKRLIDTLDKQKPEDIQESDSDDQSEDSDVADAFLDFDMSRAQSVTPVLAVVAGPAPASQSSQALGPKFTYSRQRSMLAEEDLMEQLAFDMPLDSSQASQRQRNRRGSLPTLKPLSSFREEDKADDGVAGASIRTIHELRQAGANSRFADEVEDLLDRIAARTPKQLSMRRSGLLDLANKMKDKAFVRQFRSHGGEQRLFVDIGEEVDTISGSLLVSLLVPLLAEGSVPLVVGQLQKHGIAKLFDRLLEVHKSILALTKERKTNMSKMAQSALSDYHDYLLQMPMWEELKPLQISPRTLALKCLELTVQKTREAGDDSVILSQELASNLFEILKSPEDDISWDLPHSSETIHYCLALSALESHSVARRIAKDTSIWVRHYLPVVRQVLSIALKRSVESFPKQQMLALRLTINLTNKNTKACDAMADADLMSTMARALVAQFRNMSILWTEEEIDVAVENLILLVGAMINFAAWSTNALEILDSSSDTGPNSVDDLVQLFVDNREKTFEADSQHESQKNVPFGYLSVLLGYFCLYPALERRVRAKQKTKTLRPLITAIQEFIAYHKAADNEIAADEDGHSPHVDVTEQFENLVKKLLAVKGTTI